MNVEPHTLQFDWEEVEGTPVEAVVAKAARAMDDGSLDCESIALILGDTAVVIRVTGDTDEVLVSLEDAAVIRRDWPPLLQLSEIVSHTLGWCWVGRNYRGYLDTFTLGLDGIDPAYSFTAAGCSLQCARITSIAA